MSTMRTMLRAGGLPEASISAQPLGFHLCLSMTPACWMNSQCRPEQSVYLAVPGRSEESNDHKIAGSSRGKDISLPERAYVDTIAVSSYMIHSSR